MVKRNNDWKEIILQLKKVAEENKVSQAEIARRVGKKQQYINALWNFRMAPEIETLIEIGNSLGVKLKWEEK